MVQAGISGNKYDNMSPKTFDSKRSQPKSGNDTVWFTRIIYIQGLLFYFYKLFRQGWHFLPVCIYFCSEKTGAIWIL